MQVEMREHRLRVSWPRCDRSAHDAIVERLKCIKAARFDKEQGCWFIPVSEADRLMDAFPKASYDYDAICAAVERQQQRAAIFGRSLLGMGIKFVAVDDRVIAQGAGASPLLQKLIDERNGGLLAWLQAQEAIRHP
jgi:hypothetical protein